MRILRLSTLWLTLAIAVMTLGYVNPALAEKPNCDSDPGHPSCKDDGDTETTYSVAVVAGAGSGNWVVTPVGCEGQTDSEDLTLFFPEGCPTGHVVADGVLLYLYEIYVRERKSDVMLFFTSIPVAYPIDGEFQYSSDRLPADVVEIGGSSVEVRVNLTGLQLIKGHQPDKNTTLGPIAVGNIVYTANP